MFCREAMLAGCLTTTFMVTAPIWSSWAENGVGYVCLSQHQTGFELLTGLDVQKVKLPTVPVNVGANGDVEANVGGVGAQVKVWFVHVLVEHAVA